jgi:SET family sugar efflux transporter-like MFS transporter
MDILRNRQALTFLFFLLVGTVSNAMIVPFMPFYIVKGLGEQPWTISLYTGLVVTMTVVLNWKIGKWLDEGARFFPFILASAIAFISGGLAAYLFPDFRIIASVCAAGFALSSTFMSLALTFGRQIADQAGIEAGQFNAFLRATMSTAWMLGPAFSFTLVDKIGVQQVFLAAISLGVVRLLASLWAVPAGAKGEIAPTKSDEDGAAAFDWPLWKAIAACFLLSLAHSFCFVALPLFYTQEVGLPDYAPGMAFSVKTATEIVVISTTPFLMRHFSKRNILLVTSFLALVSITALARVTSIQSLVFAQILEGAYYGLYASVSVSFVQSFARGRMGRANSLYVNTLMITGVIAGPIVGLIGQFFRFETGIHLAIIVVLAAIAGFFLAREADAGKSTSPENA